MSGCQLNSYHNSPCNSLVGSTGATLIRVERYHRHYPNHRINKLNSYSVVRKSCRPLYNIIFYFSLTKLSDHPVQCITLGRSVILPKQRDGDWPIFWVMRDQLCNNFIAGIVFPFTQLMFLTNFIYLLFKSFKCIMESGMMFIMKGFNCWLSGDRLVESLSINFNSKS